jgi:hypothetical protein
MILVQTDKIPKRDGKSNFIGHIERVEAERLLEAHDDERETERIQARIKEP